MSELIDPWREFMRNLAMSGFKVLDAHIMSQDDDGRVGLAVVDIQEDGDGLAATVERKEKDDE